MNKAKFIAKYSKESYAKVLERNREWRKKHPARAALLTQKWKKENREAVTRSNAKSDRKGGIYYDKKLEYDRTGLRCARHKIRMMHGWKWRKYKRIIDPHGLSQTHHQWIPGTAEYLGVALVEKDQHMHGFIDIIEVLEGGITLFTETEVAGGG